MTRGIATRNSNATQNEIKVLNTQTFQYHTFQSFQYHTRGFTTIGITELPIAIYSSGIGAINISDRTLKPKHIIFL